MTAHFMISVISMKNKSKASKYVLRFATLLITIAMLLCFGVFSSAESSSADGYLLTIVCKPQFDTATEMEFDMSFISKDTGTVYHVKLMGFNSFTEKMIVPMGDYAIVSVIDANDYTAVYKVKDTEFSVVGNTDIVFDLYDLNIIPDEEETSVENISTQDVPDSTEYTGHESDKTTEGTSVSNTTENNYQVEDPFKDDETTTQKVYTETQSASDVSGVQEKTVTSNNVKNKLPGIIIGVIAVCGGFLFAVKMKSN